MTETEKTATDRSLRSWLAAGPVDKSVGDGLTFVASAASAAQGKASWVLRYRYGARQREKVLGRYPDLTLKQARERARADRALLQQGHDLAALKRQAQQQALEAIDVEELGRLWMLRYIEGRHKHPNVVARVLKNHVYPVIGKLLAREVRPMHIDQVLTRTVAGGAPTVANDELRYMVRMFDFAVKRHWIEHNPAASFDLSDAGGTERSRERWLDADDLKALAAAMRSTPNFGRINELSVWLLLALCVRKMELLSAKWCDFDFAGKVWTLKDEQTKTKAAIEIPLAAPVISWLAEVKVHACGSEHLFPARRLVRSRLGQPTRNRFAHVGPDTLNVALARLSLTEVEHFTVHDMRRTARTHLAALGIDRFTAERALNHKLRGVEGTYNRHNYFEERRAALGKWADMLQAVTRVDGTRKQSVGEDGPLQGKLELGDSYIARGHPIRLPVNP